MTDDKAMVKLEELYKVAVESENVTAGLAVLRFMRSVEDADDLEGDN